MIVESAAGHAGGAILNLSSLKELELHIYDTQQEGNPLGFNTIEYLTGVNWLASLDRHPPAGLTKLALSLQGVCPRLAARFIVKLATHCPAWDYLHLLCLYDKEMIEILVHDLTAACPAWRASVRKLKRLRLNLLKIQILDQSLGNDSRPTRVKLDGRRNENWKAAIIRAARRLEHIDDQMDIELNQLPIDLIEE